jgi:hypothetical protein
LRAEAALAANPHYAAARRLGQLDPWIAVAVSTDAASDELRSSTRRLGDTKPALLIASGHHVSARLDTPARISDVTSQ